MDAGNCRHDGAGDRAYRETIRSFRVGVLYQPPEDPLKCQTRAAGMRCDATAGFDPRQAALRKKPTNCNKASGPTGLRFPARNSVADHPRKIAINKRFMATAGRQAAAGQAASQFVSTLSNDVGYQTYGQRSAKPWTAGARFWHMGAVAALG